MGGFFGVASKNDCVFDLFFGTDYHSHLGTRRAGIAAYDSEEGLQRKIHNIENAPFRTKFEHVFDEMRHFFSVYKNLENKETAVNEVSGREVALKIISAPISAARKAAPVSVEKNGLPVPQPKITTLPFSR